MSSTSSDCLLTLNYIEAIERQLVIEQGRRNYLLSSCFSNDLIGMVCICLRSLRLEHEIGNHSNHQPIMFKHALVNLPLLSCLVWPCLAAVCM